MTKINKMVMQGFKSFAKRTELLFGGDFNCVLGPNGSGKSNVLDALCFVLGRSSSKALRAEKSSNLIYNGGKSKKPSKEGEVSIFFDNEKNTFPTEDREVKVSRIVRQNGQSIYKINDRKSTRQEILDLLSVARINPEGFNIIMQGDIVRFTEMPATERRVLIEEISGISIYEEKKNKALRELERVGEKLKEAEVVLRERNSYLSDLKKERDQAIKHKELSGKVKENKATYLHLKIEKRQKIKDEFEDKIGEEKKKLDEIDAKIKEIKAENEEKKAKIDEISKEIEEKGEKAQVELHKQIESIKVELATNKTKIESFKNEINRVKQREIELKNDLEEQEKQINELKQKKSALQKENKEIVDEKNSIEGEINKFKKKHSIDDVSGVEKEIDELDKEIEEKEKEMSEIREKQQNYLREKDRVEIQIQSMDEKIGKVLEVEKENEDQIKDLKNKKQLFKKTTLELNECLANDSAYAAKLVEARQKLVSANEKLAMLNAKNLSIQENVSGSIAIQKILEQKNKIKGIYGTVSDLGKVSKKYSLALEIAAGNRIKSIVVENDKVAADCIKYLKKGKLGVATFLPLNKLKGNAIDPAVKKLLSSQGVHGLAIDLVDFEPKFKKVFQHVFSNTIVVDDVDTARRIGVGATRMTTIDGDIVEVSGAMQGGFRQRKKEGLGFQEKEVVKDISEYEEAVATLQNNISSLEEKRASNEARIAELRELKANTEGEIIKTEKTLHLETGDLDASKNQKGVLGTELKDIDEKLDKITDDVTEKNRELAQIKIKKQGLKSKISKLRNPTLVAQLNAFEEKNDQLRERIIQLDSEIKSMDIQINMVLPEQEKIKSILDANDKEIGKFNTMIENLQTTIKEKTQELKDKEEKEKEFYSKFKKLFNERTAINNDIQKNESKIESMREVSRSAEIKINTQSLENAKVSAELAGLKEEFQQYEGVPLNKQKDEEALKKEINRFELLVEQMGTVNMRALEIYEAVEKEYQALLEKKEKLMSEKEDVHEMINEIEGKKKDLFMNCLSTVEENFKRIFSDISKKGEASLHLEDEENPFEGGLLIKVRLAGTKFLDIRSLSGGEKTMTALSFIFAIQEHEPHSFYVLDEVDAALDKHNSEKLAKLIRSYADKAQYIVISHNDGIISEADNLYGVSMNEFGMTSVTSLKI